MEPRYNEVPRDRQNLFVITKPRYNEQFYNRFCYIEELFHLFYYYGGKVNRSLYQSPRYIEVHYTKVLLHYINMQSRKEK